MPHEEIAEIDRNAEELRLERQQAMWDMFEDARGRQAATLEELTEWIWGSTFRAPANRNDLPRESATKFVAIAAAMALLAGCAVTVPLREIAPTGHILTDTTDGNLTCTAAFDPECSDGSADDGIVYRRTPTAGGGNAATLQNRTLR
jgi:hypothetical protein